MGEVEILGRAHALFGGHASPVRLADDDYSNWSNRALRVPADLDAGSGHDGYRLAVEGSRSALRAAADTDAEVVRLIARAQHEHRAARQLTGRILAEARTDPSSPADSPLALREALRRRVARLRAQHEAVFRARRRALRKAALLRLLRYRAMRNHRPAGRGVPTRRAAAVRAALSRLGRPYVWGATGPDTFDCSGLVQWAYAQAGIPLHRTTYDQIHDGIAVSRSHVQPGDLVFPNTGHVQMAIGNGLVVEAPHAGARVRITQLGGAVAIRRPG